MPKVTASTRTFHFSYIYISYQMYVTWSVELCNIVPLLNRVSQANNHCISTSWKWFNIEIYSRSTWFYFELNLNFLNFYEKSPCKEKKVSINYFEEQEKPWIFSKIFQKKNKNFKAIWADLEYSKPNIFFVGQPWWPAFFFKHCPPSPFQPF